MGPRGCAEGGSLRLGQGSGDPACCRRGCGRGAQRPHGLAWAETEQTGGTESLVRSRTGDVEGKQMLGS